ncbi:MAG TPA: hypothetical protein VGK64_11345 [Bryobacteraceae bacterium]
MTPPETSAGPSLQVVEIGLTLITVALALCFPRTASGLFSRLESILGRLARKRALCVFLAGATACTLRLFLLPLSPIPLPYGHDDFSFLLAADTFAHGRLTNPTPAMWRHFESFHITVKPTYMSMYFPAQGMIMAAGKILAGHPWWGVWASCGLMCAALCWMLQGWLPPGWALLGAMLAVLRLALFSYWVNSYTGAGATAAVGGALVLGAVPRIRDHFRMRDFFWMALGMAILATSRPYEGMLVCVPVLTVLSWWYFKKPHPVPSILLRRTAPAVLVLTAMFAFMAYYDHRVFGSVFTPPYKIDRKTYAVVQHFLWQPLQPEPVYRHRIMHDFYAGSEDLSEMKYFREETRSAGSLLEADGIKLLAGALFYLGVALLPPLVMLPWALRDRRIGLLSITGVVVAGGLAIETFFLHHYIAPATAILYALLIQCMRHLRVRGPSGLFLVRATPALCIVLVALRVFAGPLHLNVAPGRSVTQLASWYGTAPVGLERARILAELESFPGPQLAIVTYAPQHMLNDWVYNAADIDKSKVIWARQMDLASDRELLNYYKDRRAWLVEPDCNPPRISAIRRTEEPAGRAMEPSE